MKEGEVCPYTKLTLPECSCPPCTLALTIAHAPVEVAWDAIEREITRATR